MFYPSGSESGGFSFTVTDGDHTSPLHRFVVTVRQLTISMEVQGELLVFPGMLPLSNSISKLKPKNACQRVPQRGTYKLSTFWACRVKYGENT